MTAQGKEDLQDVITLIQKKFGHDAIQTARSRTTPPVVSTGFEPLNNLLDGGVPRGHLTEIVGSPTSGATTIALQVIVSAHKENDVAVYFDLAEAFDAPYASQRGIHFTDLLVVKADFDSAVEVLFDVITSGIPGVVVFNTFPALSATQQGKLAMVLTRLQPILRRSRCALLVLKPYSDSESMIHSASVRLQITREAWRYHGQEIQGFDVHVTLARYKAGIESRTVQIHIPVDTDAGSEL
jgi:hypothetical protein